MIVAKILPPTCVVFLLVLFEILIYWSCISCSEKTFIYSLISNDSFAGYNNQGWQLLTFYSLKYLIPCYPGLYSFPQLAFISPLLVLFLYFWHFNFIMTQNIILFWWCFFEGLDTSCAWMSISFSRFGYFLL